VVRTDSFKFDEPLVSIITPAYNSDKFIGETIESVINQTYKNWEMIIVDDGSTDKTCDIVKKYCKRDIRVQYFWQKNSGGAAVPRNVAIGRSKGKYIAFFDSDDLWLPEKLTRQIEYMEKHPDLALVYGLAKYIGNPLFEGRLVRQPKDTVSCSTFEELFICKSIVCMTAMVRASYLQRVGLFNENPDFVSVEDWDLWLRFAHDYKIGFIPEVLGFYRANTQGISKDETKYLKPLKVIEKYENMSWVSQELAERSRYLIYFAAGMKNLQFQGKNMRRHFLKVFIGSPFYFLRLKAFCGLCFSYLPSIIQNQLSIVYYKIKKIHTKMSIQL
jgi:glycosyltransferase involved in cell wall biosynthesis